MAYIDQPAQLHAIRTHYLYHKLSAIGIRCTQPQGGFYFVANFDRWHRPLAGLGVHTSDDLANCLLEVHQLATLPGSAFGIPAPSLSLRLATSYLDLETEAKAKTLLAAYQDNPDPHLLMQKRHPNMNEAISRFGEFIDSL
jgi:aspartate aminotransferase